VFGAVVGVLEASAFDNAPEPVKWKKPLPDNALTDSIQVKS
jgi:hypothetical protein